MDSVTGSAAGAASSVLARLSAHAAAIGTDVRLVQGAGGNLSGKDGDLLWIKASGTRFALAERQPIFLAVPTAAAREQVLRTEDLSSLVVEADPRTPRRPSIELALHSLLPHRYVFHVHAVGAIAAGVAADGAAAALARLAGVAPSVGVVPYAKPGIALARAVLAALQDDAGGDDGADAGADDGAHDHEGDHVDTVLLLANHGLLTASDDADRARALVDAVEAALRTGAPSGAALPLTVEGDVLAPAGSVSPAGAALLTGGVLTPDEAVFLGARPFAATLDEALAAVGEDGSVVVRPDLSPDAREVALSFVHVAAHASAGAHYLAEAQVAEIVDWEAEKWRQGLAR